MPAKLGSDTLALSRFVTLKQRERVCDLGCGGGELELELLERQPDLAITAVDILPSCAEETRRNTAGLNVTVLQSDWNELSVDSPFDAVVCNPPYFDLGSGAVSPDPERAAARSMERGGLERLCAAMARLTRFGGRAAVVYRAEKLTLLLGLLSDCKLEPKRLRFAHHDVSKPASFALVEARRGGNPGLEVLPPLILYHSERTTCHSERSEES
ncbi:O-methyltransferase [Clostridia bacterium]|nr:O-methyltransferase [Clostridia bacterium]